jgi:hypothetical protein
MSKPTCETCRWWDGVWECRRFPPIPVWNGRDNALEIQYRWPDTDKNDWCGEHAPKGEG